MKLVSLNRLISNLLDDSRGIIHEEATRKIIFYVDNNTNSRLLYLVNNIADLVHDICWEKTNND